MGAGFSGLGMAIRLKQRGQRDFVVIEKAADIGGTWRDNTYPGCACDSPSHLYSFSFALNPHWSRACSPQPEIWDYLRRCAERFGILPYIQYNSELLDASWNEDDQSWHITTAKGQLIADILILGNGPLSEPSLPAIPGIARFEGVVFHSAQWNHEYDLAGKRVAVIGTGASAVQFVPQIQPRVAQLSLLLRTPRWILPRRDHAIPSWQRALFRLLPITQRFVRTRIYWRQELLALGFVYRPDMMESAMRLAQRHLAEQVPNPELRAKLTPYYLMGCKRILLSDDFYPALTQPNVELVTNRIREVRANSIVTEDGREHEIDAIICGTGFHVTDAQLPRYVHGRGGSLDESWRPDPRAYLGTTVSGFPNLFLLIGPNTGLGHNSMIFMIESQINYILDCLRIEELLKEPYLSSGMRGKRPASSRGTARGGKPADNVSDGSSRKGHPATHAIYADEWGVAPRRNLRKRRYYRRGKWLIPSSQKPRRLAHWFLSPMRANPLSPRPKAGSYRVLSLLRR